MELYSGPCASIDELKIPAGDFILSPRLSLCYGRASSYHARGACAKCEQCMQQGFQTYSRQAYKKVNKYLKEAVRVTATFQPVLTEETAVFALMLFCVVRSAAGLGRWPFPGRSTSTAELHRGSLPAPSALLSEKVATAVWERPWGRDVIFDCREGTLKAGLVPEKGGLVINDKVLYEVDVSDSYFTLDDGEYGERCIVIWLEKRTREQNWYAYDRFEPVSERFLLEGEKKKAELKFEITQKCFFDVEIDEKKMGRIVFGLYGDIMPRTVENFKCLCTGEKGTSESTGEPLHYKGTRFHRVIPGFCIQGGQTFENEEGSGGESIYGPTFEDENLRMKFTNKGLIAMANGGPNTNGSQFFITTAKAEHLNFKSVGFGEVLDGYEVVQAIESLGTVDGEPEENAVIVDCGTMDFDPGEKEHHGKS
eukprot:g18542.t1